MHSCCGQPLLSLSTVLRWVTSPVSLPHSAWLPRSAPHPPDQSPCHTQATPTRLLLSPLSWSWVRSHHLLCSALRRSVASCGVPGGTDLGSSSFSGLRGTLTIEHQQTSPPPPRRNCLTWAHSEQAGGGGSTHNNEFIMKPSRLWGSRGTPHYCSRQVPAAG